jgi:putative spermidine/putrescine transport system substrate-binding protein
MPLSDEGKPMLTRRQALQGVCAGALAGLPLRALAGAPAPDLSHVTLRVAVWGGAHHKTMHNEVWPLFEKSGGRIEYVFGNARDHLPKLIAARGRNVPFDVAILDDAVQAEAIDLGLLEPLDPARLSNMADLYPESIPRKGFGPAKNTVSTGIAYNTEKFKELGLPAPRGWADLFNPKLAGRVAIPDLSVVMGAYTLVGLAALAGGDQSNASPGFKKLKELNAYYYYRSSSDLETKFASGDVWAAAWVNGRSWALQKEGLPISFVDPVIGDRVGMVGFNTADVVKGTAVGSTAEHYINLLLDPRVQLGFARSMFYGPTNRLAGDMVAADPNLAGKFPYRPDDFRKMTVLDWKIVNARMPQWVDEWNRTLRS